MRAASDRASPARHGLLGERVSQRPPSSSGPAFCLTSYDVIAGPRTDALAGCGPEEARPGRRLVVGLCKPSNSMLEKE